MLFAIISWAVAGLIVGFIVSKNVNLRGDDPKFGIACGAIGAIVSGLLYRMITGIPVVGFNLWSIIFAAIGAAVVVAAWHFMRSRVEHA
jgi:uncharacterized membrane protein YeaQ/YmgE (transglycosylase-associated protein family)